MSSSGRHALPRRVRARRTLLATAACIGLTAAGIVTAGSLNPSFGSETSRGAYNDGACANGAYYSSTADGSGRLALHWRNCTYSPTDVYAYYPDYQPHTVPPVCVPRRTDAVIAREYLPSRDKDQPLGVPVVVDSVTPAARPC